jgi:hypothetical protein
MSVVNDSFAMFCNGRYDFLTQELETTEPTTEDRDLTKARAI